MNDGDTRIFNEILSLVGSIKEIDTLKELIKSFQKKIFEMSPIPAPVIVRFETIKNFNPKSHGAAYVAILKSDGKGGVDRLWVKNNGRHYDGRKNTYFTSFTCECNNGDYIEARLKSSSYEDKKEYFVIHEDRAIPVTREEAIKNSENSID